MFKGYLTYAATFVLAAGTVVGYLVGAIDGAQAYVQLTAAAALIGLRRAIR